MKRTGRERSGAKKKVVDYLLARVAVGVVRRDLFVFIKHIHISRLFPRSYGTLHVDVRCAYTYLAAQG